MNLLFISQLLALAGIAGAILGLAWRWRWTRSRPWSADRSPARGSPTRGLLYAFTLGMAPWAKESTRRHMLAYLRGVAFHLGIFSGLGALLLSPWWARLPDWILWTLAAATGLGALFGAAGEIARRVEHNLRAMSTPDDHASVILVSLFLAATSAALVWPALMPGMYLVAALMLIYIPLGKIRHCIYFFFSRRFFGLFIGRRGVVHPPAARVRPSGVAERG